MTDRLPIELTYDEAKLVIQAFALSDERYIERSVDVEIRDREALVRRFDRLQSALGKAQDARRLAAEVNQP